MSIWDIGNRGFLTVNDPISSIFTNKHEYIPYIARLENIPSVINHWAEARCVREELVSNLRDVSALSDYAEKEEDEAKLERLFHLYSYMAHFYVFAPSENVANRLPAEIAIPLVVVANKLKRSPILSYISAFLMNWERIDEDEEISYKNIRPLIFEKNVPYFVDMEFSAKTAISACQKIIDNSWEDSGNVNNVVLALDVLTEIDVALLKINKIFSKFDFSDSTFGFIADAGFKSVVFEGVSSESFTLDGFNFSQSPTYRLFESIKTLFIKDLHPLPFEKLCLPSTHVKFLEDVEKAIQSSNFLKLLESFRHDSIDEAYAECHEHLLAYHQKTAARIFF